MNRLFLLRHAKAAWAGPGMQDFDRPLEEAGLRSLDRLAQAMRADGVFPERLLVSAARRTRETALGLVERLGVTVETRIDDTLYSGGAGEYIAAIRRHGDVERLMLVGHNPSIDDLAQALSADGDGGALDRLRDGFPTAALATFAVAAPLTQLSQGAGFLESFPLPARKSA